MMQVIRQSPCGRAAFDHFSAALRLLL